MSAKLKAFETQYYAFQTQLPAKMGEAAAWLQHKLDEILKIDPPTSGPMLATAGGNIEHYGIRAAGEGELIAAWPNNPLGVPPEIAMASRADEDAARSASTAARDENVHINDGHSSTATNEVKLAPIDFEGHIFKGEVKRNGKVVGGHAIITDDVRIVPGTETAPNSLGVYEAQIEVADPKNPGQYIRKNNTQSGTSTMFPKDWDAQRIKEEVSHAYYNKTMNDGIKWEGITPSGVKIRGYVAPKVTAYPVL